MVVVCFTWAQNESIPNGEKVAPLLNLNEFNSI